MKILVACEESQIVTAAFRERGHEAYSCDLLETSGSRWDWHIPCDVRNVLDQMWDMMIAFPPCTHLAVSGARWFKDKAEVQKDAIDFFMTLANCDIPYIAIENPISIMSRIYRKPDQIIQPWQFGHGEVKATCLWLKNLPKLVPTNIVEGREPKVWKMGPSKDRSRLRSRTYPGIAQAMAEQWGQSVPSAAMTT